MKRRPDQAPGPAGGIAGTSLLAATLATASLALAVSAPIWEQQAVRFLFELWIAQP